MHTKRQKTQYEEIQQASEPGMARMLDLSNQEFKTTMLNRLRTLIEKAACNADGQYKQRDGSPKRIFKILEIKSKAKQNPL